MANVHSTGRNVNHERLTSDCLVSSGVAAKDLRNENFKQLIDQKLLAKHHPTIQIGTTIFKLTLGKIQAFFFFFLIESAFAHS